MPRGLHDRVTRVHTPIRAATERLDASIERCTPDKLLGFARLGHALNPPPLSLAA